MAAIKQTDLFGAEVTHAAKTGKIKQIDRLHNAFGTMPGERCKNCTHFIRKGFSKTYFKCALARDTASESTDIRANDIACGKFEKPT